MAQVEMMNHPAFNHVSMSTSHRDITDEKYKELRRPRKVRFFCNGDRYFKGKRINITPHKYVTFNDLLNDLTEKLPNSVQLPYGVRQIFTPLGGKRVRDIASLQDGQHYVCGGFESFKQIKYGGELVEKWSVGKPHNHDFYHGYASTDGGVGTGVYGKGYYQAGGFQPSRTLRQSYPQRRTYGAYSQRGGYAQWPGGDMSYHVKPKVVSVVRNGPSPRNNVKILLNRKSVQSFPDLMSDISEAFGPKWKNNKVRRLFTIRGREVQGVADFFRDDDNFIAVGNETLTLGNVQDILEEMYPESPYAKSLLKDWQRARKKNKLKENNEDTKRDSGLGSDSSNNKEDPEEILVLKKGDRKGRRKKDYVDDPEDLKLRLDRARVKAAEEERDRARRQMQKRFDAERRQLHEERKKRSLAPLRQGDDQVKRLQAEREQQRREAEAQQKALREEENRLRAERAKLAKMKAKEDEPKVIVVVKEGDDNGGRKSRSRPHRKKEDDTDSDYETPRSKSRPKKTIVVREETEEPQEVVIIKKKPREPRLEDNKQKEKDEGKEKSEVKPKVKSPEPQKEKSDPPKEVKRRNSKHEKPKEPEKTKDVDDPKKPRKAKTKIVFKTKLERQISNPMYAKDKYEVGKVLGDGNFAVVKQCRLKNTTNDYAMKIIDKSKMKGKEHMVENEINIMKDCQHPNIVKLIEEYETTDEIYLIMELVKGGDLFDAITQSVKFSEPVSAGMVADLASSLVYLHSRIIVHRDLKPENLLVHRNKDGSISLKLADFGLAMEVKEQIYTVCGTPTYVAPEILSEIGYGLEVDNWALGVISYILLCGFPPFRSTDRNQTELFEFIKAGEFEYLSPYWDNVSESAKDLISKLLVVDRNKRYSSIDVLCHPWVITRGGSVAPPANLPEYRRKLRHDLDAQSKIDLESYRNRKS